MKTRTGPSNGIVSWKMGLCFSAVLGGLYILLTFQSVYQRTLVITDLSATLAGAAARLMHLPITLTGTTLATSKSAITVGRGCDGIDVLAILLAATVATPATIKRRAGFLACGVAGLLVLNVARLLSLLYAQSFSPGFMQALHIYVWPVILLSASMGLWYKWFEPSQAE